MNNYAIDLAGLRHDNYMEIKAEMEKIFPSLSTSSITRHAMERSGEIFFRGFQGKEDFYFAQPQVIEYLNGCLFTKNKAIKYNNLFNNQQAS
jgi:hypothetical protein